MAKIAVLVDLGFYLKRYPRVMLGQPTDAVSVAKNLYTMVWRHVEKSDDLYRVLCYDCAPLTKKVHNPVTNKAINFAKTETSRFRLSLHNELKSKRKVALRLGELRDGKRWMLTERATKALLKGELKGLQESDVVYDIKQKGVDTKIGIDIASLAYKRLVDRIVLVTADSDFVPAAKLARREGIDVVLDPMWAAIDPSLHEHIDGLRSTWQRPKSNKVQEFDPAGVEEEETENLG